MERVDPSTPTNSIRRRAKVGLILLAVALTYFGCAAMATYPVIGSAGSRMPGRLADPLEHLWIMRWTESCLTRGHAPFFCEGLQHPLGSPLGLYPTMHVQTAGYMILGLLTSNDVARFNTLWFAGFVTTGLSGFILGWWTSRSFWPAWLAGLGLMLCGPMLMHAHGHLETMQMGAVPLFLIAWLRFVDRPGRGRLAVATLLYLLVVACAPYFAVLAIFPAGWYVAWSLWREGSGSRWAWIRPRLPWLAGFAVAAMPGLAVLFSSQIWAAAHGYEMSRPRSQFNWFGAPMWGYLVPSGWHALGRPFPSDLYEVAGQGRKRIESVSYLGLLAVTMLAYAGAHRIRFARAGYWWSALALMVVLSCGASGPFGVPMPAGWLYSVFPPFHLIRVPARFNLFAAVCAVVPVAAAFRHLLGRIEARGWKGAAVALIAMATVADLSIVPFPTETIPAMSPIYRDLVRDAPHATLLEAPLFPTSKSFAINALCGYWQSYHGARTSAGYSGIPNLPFDAEIVEGSPWSLESLERTDDLARAVYGPVRDMPPRDYAWLYLTTHHFDDLVFHNGPMVPLSCVTRMARWDAELADARVAQDATMTVYERAKIPEPTTPVAAIGPGWRRIVAKKGAAPTFAALRSARLTLFNPDAERLLSLTLVGAATLETPRVVRLLDAEGRERSKWSIGPDGPRTVVASSLRLGRGLQTLTLVTDGEDRPKHGLDAFDEAKSAYGFRLSAIELRPSEATAGLTTDAMKRR